MTFLLLFLSKASALFYAITGGGSWFFPEEASTSAAAVDWLFLFVFWICLFFFVLILAVMIVFIIRYHAREGVAPKKGLNQHLFIEWTWTLVPLLLVMVIFYVGFKEYLRMTTAPANAYQVIVTGQQWKWMFTYPNGYVDENLHVPVHTPVRLLMSSEDVLHSFYVPAFRVKQDVVPGRYSEVWFNAVKSGEFQIFCAEYCGLNHSNMLAKVIVHPPGEFEIWLNKASNFLETMSPPQAGERLYKLRGCAQCHSMDGTAGTCPTFKGVFGHKVALQGGTSVLVDENYIRESILEPQAKVVAGFDPVMPTYQGRLNDREIMALIAYIKTLK